MSKVVAPRTFERREDTEVQKRMGRHRAASGREERRPAEPDDEAFGADRHRV